ncbi:SAM-dependent methyltransferase [Marinicella rhabdoformis]|uniref:SAM-dependent methyltransferase n=1 Tax=Marinicella rhabdoformis TaxID=2580566 RepID=UPI001C552929|nr:cyclopropane-fatty-acyl-phospholipid synthase family protein [Marinicella rhabdoformis]
MKTLLNMIEKGWVPDVMVRHGIRQLLKVRLTAECRNNPHQAHERYESFLQTLKKSPLAIATDKANEQHYEVDARFYDLALGVNKKYSACYYQTGDDLDRAETRMLEKYLERAQLSDGQQILELGCGWGSLTLFMAKHLPSANITAVSNSASQKAYILSQAESRGLNNISVITQDINQLELNQQFDRVVSVEMFEHVRNYQQLFANISSWLKHEGMLFIHVFCHRFLMYPFEEEGDDNWMGKYFFSGGQMPAFDTFLNFQDDLRIQKRWAESGKHYQKTANHWLENTDKNKSEILALFQSCYGDDAQLWFQRWRMFFMSCAELFGYNQGSEWLVGHYLFSNNKNTLVKVQ